MEQGKAEEEGGDGAFRLKKGGKQGGIQRAH